MRTLWAHSCQCLCALRACTCRTMWQFGYGAQHWRAYRLASSGAGNLEKSLCLQQSTCSFAVRLSCVLCISRPASCPGAYATNRPGPPPGSSSSSPSQNGGSFIGLQSSSADPQQQPQHQCLGEGLRVVPLQEWHGRLRQLLTDMPGAMVGGERQALTSPSAKPRG
jgi:hypothetical protein